MMKRVVSSCVNRNSFRPYSTLSKEEIVRVCKEHTFFSWSAQKTVNPLAIAKEDGVHVWDFDGKKYMDFNSGLMCSNIGHGNQKVINAICEQAKNLAFVGPSYATEIRAKAALKLNEFTPGNLKKYFFTLGGAEANENAIKFARGHTGRYKILTRFRSYHGSTHAAMMLTGDPRRWANEPGMGGVVRAFDPYMYRSQLYRPGDTEEEFVARILSLTEETLMHEGPQNFAAVLIEPVTGTNGILIPPKGYLKGLRAMCDKYGILLICDEVMSGLGRTGKNFAVDHWDVVPDILTMAKGLTSAYLPLGAIAVSPKVAASFDEKPFPGGLTYQSHPMCLAAAVANLEVLQELDVVGNSHRMGKVMSRLHQEMKAKHPCVGDVRNIGLFGILELIKSRKTKEPLFPHVGYNEVQGKILGYLREHGVLAMASNLGVHTNPPLIINEEQLVETFKVFDEALKIGDAAMVE